MDHKDRANWTWAIGYGLESGYPLSPSFNFGLKLVCAFAGINYSSPILAAAMGNLIPGLTFVFAIIFRDQKKPGLGGIDFPPPLFLTSRSFKGGLFKILMDEFSHET
ncbi:hypothetical protein LguiB_000514 [Lonicera macranthoides]